MVDVLGVLRAGLAPHYSVEREIGAGGMARVFLAVERHPARKVAVKVMNPEVSSSEFRERFIREVELTSRLSHPHIVPILAAEECLFVPDGPDGLCYYVMPYIEGESLRARLEREQRLPLDEAVRIALEVADALSYAHAHSIIHRDIKPENILLSGDHAWVADFGIARAVSAAGGHSLTGGNPVGSLAYMSPEQLMGSRAIDARTDVYSLGGVFYEMLVGEPPLLRLAGKTPHGGAALDAVLRAQRVSHRSERFVKEIITRALAPEPDDRFVSVDEFVARLRDVVGRGLRLPRVRWKAVLLLGAAATAIGVVGAVVLGGARRRSTRGASSSRGSKTSPGIRRSLRWGASPPIGSHRRWRAAAGWKSCPAAPPAISTPPRFEPWPPRRGRGRWSRDRTIVMETRSASTCRSSTRRAARCGVAWSRSALRDARRPRQPRRCATA